MSLKDGKNVENLKTKECSMFSLDTDHSVKTWVEGINLSNGLAWTSDNKTMYHTDTLVKTIYAFDYDGDSGRVSK